MDVVRDHGYHPLRVKRIVQETPDARSYVLDVPDELKAAFSYSSGQFCTFRVRIGSGDDAVELYRSYSMSSAPGIDADLTVTVKQVPGGAVSNWLHENVSEGDVLECNHPAGVFTLRENERPVVALCGGSGITPVLGITKTALHSTERQVALLYANRSADSVIFDKDLLGLTDAHPGRLAVTHHLDAESGLLTADAVRAFIEPFPLDADYYLCGPTPFMDLVEQTLLERGVTAEHILLERFGVTPGVAAVPTEAADAAGAGTGGEAEAGTVTLTLKGKTHEVDYKPGDTILETARRGGIQPPYSCEAGNCATCMAKLLSGEVRMHANTALTDDEVEEGWILTCQSVLVSPSATVEYE